MLMFPINTKKASRTTIERLIELGILIKTRDGFHIVEKIPADRKSEQG